MESYEKLGAFYLGKTFDPQAGQVEDDLVLYDAKDLTTHAVCVGMTGSGKTGLCLSLLEEAALDGVPAICIDPKGDLGNLLLAFPELRPEDFRPWVDDGEAARKGQSPEQYAKSVAELWRKGLGQWGQDGARIARYRDAVDVAIYTPGSNAGLQLKVLSSFSAPSAAVLEDSDALRERILSSVSGLLALLGIDADPIQSREHILLSNILHHAWMEGRDLELADLIREIQQPPFDRVGILELDTFYPAGDRMKLSLLLNNLLASPGFAAWMEGEPLDIQRLLWTAEGKPRLTILSIAHLSDAERMFFVTLLLGEIVSWMRGQSGTTSLRALLYMDEVFGYLPPTANPPSKIPLLTLLKQARAYGLGVMLATQNPVDLDYKALSNTGTWFLGRLQTERDKARVLDGLEGAAQGGFDRATTEAILSGLDSRVFMLHNVHEDAPVVMHTRWAMSYLRGPLTRGQIQRLMKERKAAAAAAPAKLAPAATAEAVADEPEPSERPLVPEAAEEAFLSRQERLAQGSRLVYRPALACTVRLHYARVSYRVDQWQTVAYLAALSSASVLDPWESAKTLEEADFDTDPEPEDGASFAELPSAAGKAKQYTAWKKELISYLYRSRPMNLWKCLELKTLSKPGESEGDFRIRLTQVAREQRDLAVSKLQQKYGPKLERIQSQIARAQDKVDVQRSQHSQQKMSTVISIGSTLLGAMFGRKLGSRSNVGRASTSMRSFGRIGKEKDDVKRAEEQVREYQEKLQALEAEFQEKSFELQQTTQPTEHQLEHLPLSPRKSDISIVRLGLVWVPWSVDKTGIAEPLAG